MARPEEKWVELFDEMLTEAREHFERGEYFSASQAAQIAADVAKHVKFLNYEIHEEPLVERLRQDICRTVEEGLKVMERT